MSDFLQFIRNNIYNELVKNKQGIVCEVISFDGDLMRADVQPMLQVQNGDDDPEDYAPLQDVPVGFIYGGGGSFIKPDYQEGDHVWVSFSTHDMDEALEGSTDVESEDINNMSNCIVVGGLVVDDWTAPENWLSEGLVFGNENLTIQIIDNKVIIKNSDAEFTIEGGELSFDNGNGTIEMSSSGDLDINNGHLKVLS